MTTIRPSRKGRISAIILGVIAIALIALVLLWNWDWFIPPVERLASGKIGRRVTIAHLHVHLGWPTTTVAADGIVVPNPDKFPYPDQFTTLKRLTVVANVSDYIRRRTIVLPSITLDEPDIHAVALDNGADNWTLHFPQAPPSQPNAKPPQIGNLQINGGKLYVVDPKFKSNFAASLDTREGPGRAPVIEVNARGTYAAQPVTALFVGGALLSLRDAKDPYPINLRVENGPTKASLVGTVENPLSFAGARLKLSFSGPNMALLYPLTGIPIPQTPPFSIAGDLDYRKPDIRFTSFEGRVGSSDLEGDIAANPRPGERPDVTMNLRSRRVDLADLGGFVGAPAGTAKDEAGETSEQKRELTRAKTSKALFPSTPIDLPKVRAADIHLKYHADHIENKFTPFDKLNVALDIDNGRIDLHPLDFVVGNGNIESNILLAPGSNDVIHAKANIDFQHIELARLMQATHTFKGDGVIGGQAKIDTNGNSLASMMSQGNGELKLALVSAGDVSALLVDIAGLEFGNALLSALGVPQKAKIECFVTDLPLKDGVVTVDALVLDTSEARVLGKGTIDLRNQTMDTTLTTRSKHFSIGSLPGPINLTGPITSPAIRPGAEVVARAGAAVGLGIVLTPLGALLPTIQFGVGKDNACVTAEAEERQPIKTPPRPRHAHR